MTLKQPDQTNQRSSAWRMRIIGNLLIICSVALLGAALGVSAMNAPGNTETPPSRVSDTNGPSSAPETATETASQENSWPAALQLVPAPDESSSTASSNTESDSEAEAESDGESSTGTNDDPEPTETSTPQPLLPGPEHLVIPSVGIDTSVIEVGYEVIDIDGQEAIEWEVADYAAGHHNLSANPGEGGNVVISGHVDWKGEVFRTLENVQPGDEVIVSTADGEHHYAITEVHFRREVGVSLEERLATGTFMAPMPDERLTIITCWPYGINDHRIIVVAKPLNS